MSMQTVTAEMLRRYDKPGPRYTSYPTALEWREDFGAEDYVAALGEASGKVDEPLSLYVHIPFCDHRCAFCGCNVIASTKEAVLDKYVGYLERELGMLSRALGARRRLSQVHWGGGTPTSLEPGQLRRLYAAITSRFEIEPTAEIAIEADPRVTTQEQVGTLRALGFNRLSMGVQDFDEHVQREIDRHQTETQTRALLGWAREAAFGAVNIDLIYGLPGQTLATWQETIEKIVELRPDRLAIYSFAHLPDRLHHQRRIDASQLPDTETKYRLLAMAREELLRAGYCAIGMDHFALPHDELTLAKESRTLSRNFMGYTVAKASDSVGVGVSAIGEIAGCYVQNAKKLSAYYEALDAERFAVTGGCRLTRDDVMRGWVIRELMCNGFVDVGEFARRFGIGFGEYFREEQDALAALERDGFLELAAGDVRVLPLGQVFIRNVAMVFDAYLKRGSGRAYSRTV